MDNAQQVEFWNGAGGQSWVQYQKDLDRAIGAFGEFALEQLAAQAGERVLEVGCGAGTTSLELGRAVGATGRVLGVDVSEALLGLARSRCAHLKQIDFLLADAGQASLPKDFDALFSRFGVMFFEQPAVAFRNLRGSLRPGGQLGFVAWQEPAANPWLTHVTQCVLPFLPEAPPAPDPRAPGPFAFGDPDYMEAALMRAGFGEIEIREFRADVPFGAGGLQAAMDFALQVGPAARLTAELPPATLERVQVALSELFEANLVDGVVSLPGATWIVAARN